MTQAVKIAVVADANAEAPIIVEEGEEPDAPSEESAEEASDD